MKHLLITGVAVLIAGVLPGCKNGHESATGTPRTDISATSTESGGYANGSPYSVLDQRRDGNRLVIDVSVRDTGRADDIGRRVVNEKKGDATAVTVHVYRPDAKPPQAPARTIEWTAASGFTGS